MVFFLISLFTMSSAQAAFDCKYEQMNANATAAAHFFTATLGCVVNITPIDKPNQVYREYYFDERGRFLIFDSVNGSWETSTGYRSYFIFPRGHEPNFKHNSNGGFLVQLASGTSITISTESSRIIEFPGYVFNESQQVDLSSSSFEISSHPGILLDTGWRLARASYFDSGEKSVFSDPSGKKCNVVNDEIFDYVNAIYGEPLFRFQSEEKLADFLSFRCPDLDLTSLFH